MINCGAGVVDFDYRGEVGVVLFNHGEAAFEVGAGDRVAQLILEKVCMAGCQEVESLDATSRGAGGFGSTGVAGAAAAPPGIVAGEAPVVADCQNESLSMRVQRLKPSAALPVRGSDHAAGFDLAAAEPATVKAGGKAIVKTGLAVAIPWGTYARIAPRSGLAAKRMIHVGAGVVDYDYRGEVGVVLFNHGAEDFEVAAGDRVAQLVLEEISMVPCAEVETLDDTARGAGGFGSTGVSEGPTPSKRPRSESETQAKEVAALKQEMAELKAKLAALTGGVA